MKVAIIGMGVAGISVLREWTKKQQETPTIQVTVFGGTETFGTGQAFQQDAPDLLMNLPAISSSMIPEKESDFADWMRDHYGETSPAEKFYARAQYGEYMNERMNEWLIQSNATVVREKVETIRPLENGQYRLTWKMHEEVFDVVHLCIGNLPYQDPYDLHNHPHAIQNPFPMKKSISKLPHGATVGVLGTGLTAIDVFRYTFAYRPDLNVVFFSRSGSFKTIISDAPSFDNQYLTKENIERYQKEHNGTIPLKTYLEWFTKELEHHQVSWQEVCQKHTFGSKRSFEQQLQDPYEIGIIQKVMKNITFIHTDLWMALTEADKHLFMKKYYKTWDKLRAPFPPETGENVLYAWKTNQIQVYDHLEDIKKNEQSFRCIMKKAENIEVDYVVNATGNDLFVSHETKERALLQQLLNERILQAEAFGGVQVTVPHLSVISQKHGVMKNFKVHGQLIAGIQFGNSSVRIISESARTAVNHIFID